MIIAFDALDTLSSAEVGYVNWAQILSQPHLWLNLTLLVPCLVASQGYHSGKQWGLINELHDINFVTIIPVAELDQNMPDQVNNMEWLSSRPKQQG